ncbi:MAG: GNAT family N-acetyltransferase [Sphingomonadaceae bacterium]|nr:GNAT family N-acetyltransferase [Sphingomonadaceae bacterium]
MTPVGWRRAGPEDAEALAHLGAATFLTTFAFDHPGKPLIDHLNTEHSVAYYTGKLADPAVDIVIGETPLGAPVGYVMMVPPEHPQLQQDGDIELKRIYLLGPWQGGGNGRALLDQALAVAKRRMARRVLLAVYESNKRAVAFYERAGFRHIGETVFMVGEVPFRDMVYARPM